ncbi:MAG TPA: YajQ family cyclic di-GMP-binding protein [Pseudomonadales bacterium]|nr:YajQ family cyclic di-GMP-binding protein [Pseudomonadales bacterium]
MPSFDVVSEVDFHEVANAVDQANREIDRRFDLKGTGSKFELNGAEIKLSTSSDFQVKQLFEILQAKLIKRNIDIKCLECHDPTPSGKEVFQVIEVKQGLDAALCKEIVKLIKDKKMKVQASIQGEKVRVTGKKRDDLQEVIAMLREENLKMPLQFDNFRE